MSTNSISNTNSSQAMCKANKYSKKHLKRIFSTSWKTLRCAQALSQSSRRTKFSLMTPDKWLCIHRQDSIFWQRSLTKMLARVSCYRQTKCTSMWAKASHSSNFLTCLYSAHASVLPTLMYKANRISKCFLLKWHVCCLNAWNSHKVLLRSNVECIALTQVAKLFFHQDQ